ncbi:MAG: outer membrane protein assembly factor BamD [Cellvibrionaceae bacterium]
MRSTSRFLFIALLSSLLSLTGCSSTDEKKEPRSYTAEEFYKQGVKQLKYHDYEGAILNFQGLEAEFPFSRYAEQAQLELIYAYYKDFDYEAADSAADRFIRLHPHHSNVDYAYYMKGLAASRVGGDALGDLIPVDNSQRDPAGAREAFSYFAQLLELYPDSRYAADARKRMVHLRNLLARNEIHAANYYFKRGAWLAAANRGKYVVENFAKTPAVADGLAVIIQAYTLLGSETLAKDALATLKLNFPDYPYLDKNGNFVLQSTNENRTWLNRASFGLFGKSTLVGFDTRELYNPQYKLEEDD